MSIRTTNNNKGHILSGRSPVRTLLNSEFQSAIKWLARKKDKDGKRIGKITEAESVVKYEKDTFSMYAKAATGKTVSINDIQGDAVFLRRLPDGKLDMADCFVFCMGGGHFIMTDWITVWHAMDKLYHDKGSVIYSDCWRMDRIKFIALLNKAASGKL